MNSKAAALGLVVVGAASLALFVVLGGDSSADTTSDDGARKRPRGAGQRIEVDPDASAQQPSPDPVAPDATDPSPTTGEPPANQGSAHPASANSDQSTLLVSCALDGKPLEGATVFGRYSDGSLGEWRTGADGEVRVPVPPGLKVSVAASHRFAVRLDWRPPVPGGGSLRFAFNKGAQSAFLEGTLVDDNGQPVGDGELVLYDAQQAGSHAVLDPQQIQLRPDGRFAFELGAGKYALRGRSGPSESPPVYCTLEPGQRHDAGKLLVPRPSKIIGRVQLPPNLSLTFPVRVRLMTEVRSERPDNELGPPVWGRRIVRNLELDASLGYSLDLPPGDLRVRVEVPIPGDHQVGLWKGVALEPGSEQEVDLELTELSVAVRGVVRDDTGSPIAGARVGYRGTSAVTDEQGGYVLRGLDMGDLELVVHAGGHEQGFLRRVYTGSAVVEDFDLRRLGGLRGVVRDREGAPAANVSLSITLRKDTGEVVPFDARSGGSGGYSLNELLPGNYSVAVGASRVDVVVRPGEDVDAPELTLP